jgi:hypothetical protein
MMYSKSDLKVRRHIEVKSCKARLLRRIPVGIVLPNGWSHSHFKADSVHQKWIDGI